MNGSIAIAGGGIIGLSVAWQLAQSGWQVEVFDRGVAGNEASWAGAGMLAPGGEVESDTPLAALAIESRALYPAFVKQLQEESALPIDLQEAGALELAYSAEEMLALNQKSEIQASLGIASRPLAPKQIIAFWPRVRSSGLAGARFYPGDGIVNPREVVAALRAALDKRGVPVHQNCALRHVALTESHVAVTSECQTRHFAAVVVAMGAWSSTLAISEAPPLPAAEPVKGHLIGYRQPDQTCSTIVRHGHTYLLQRSNGLLIVGASVEHTGFDRTLRPEIIEDLREQASLVFPHLGETTPTESWIGFRPGAESLQLGPWYSPRVQLAYGHYRNGILLAPVTGRRVTEALANLPR